MKKTILPLVVLLIATIETTFAFTLKNSATPTIEINKDSLRIAELDKFWTELARTVREGDFESYSATYHEDAVVIFASGKNKTSIPAAKALAGWKQGFIDTKSGKNKSDVKFRFSQRIGDKTTAHETGIFIYTSSNSNGENEVQYRVHFEMLLIKRDDKWLGVMEYQKSDATEEEWEGMKR
jgi:ketosteroid isomerase-like protein